MSRRRRNLFTYPVIQCNGPTWATEWNARRTLKTVLAHGKFEPRGSVSYGPVALPFRHRRRKR